MADAALLIAAQRDAEHRAAGAHGRRRRRLHIVRQPHRAELDASAWKVMNHLNGPGGVDRQIQIGDGPLAVGAGKADRLAPPVGRLVAARRSPERAAFCRSESTSATRRTLPPWSGRISEPPTRSRCASRSRRPGVRRRRRAHGTRDGPMRRSPGRSRNWQTCRRVAERAAAREESCGAVVPAPFGHVPRHVVGAERAGAKLVGRHRHRRRAVEVRAVQRSIAGQQRAPRHPVERRGRVAVARRLLPLKNRRQFFPSNAA